MRFIWYGLACVFFVNAAGALCAGMVSVAAFFLAPGIAMAALGSLVVWATSGTVRCRNLPEARGRALRMRLPATLTDAQAEAMNKELGYPADHGHPGDLPGRANAALHDYFIDKHDAAEMERLLDERCGVGDYAIQADAATDRILRRWAGVPR